MVRTRKEFGERFSLVTVNPREDLTPEQSWQGWVKGTVR